MIIQKFKHGVLCFFLAIACLLPLSSYAQDRGLLISPKRIVFEKGDRLHELRLVNRGDSPQKYRISIVNRAMQKNGQLKPTDKPAANEFFAADILRYGPRQIELNPKEAQTVRLMSRITGNNPDGEYRSHILIQEIPKPKDAQSVKDAPADGLGLDIQAIFGISIPVFFRKGDLSAEVSLTGPKVKKYNEDTYVEFDINRSGNKSIFGTAKIFENGTQIAILKGIAVYLSASTRTIAVKIPNEYAKAITGKKLRIIFGAVQEEEDSPPAEVSFVAN